MISVDLQELEHTLTYIFSIVFYLLKFATITDVLLFASINKHHLLFLNVTATQSALFRKVREKLTAEPTQTK